MMSKRTRKRRVIRLTRKQRQLRLIVIVMVLTTVILRNLPKSSKPAKSFVDNYDQVAVTIEYGDRAWNIQRELTPDEDTREMLFHLQQINGKSMGNIIPGEQIVFLKTKDN